MTKNCSLAASAAMALAIFSQTVLAGEKTLDCDKAMNTLEINQCAGIELKEAEATMGRYLEQSLAHNDHDPELVSAIESAQAAWEDYISAHCDAVYTQWREGTIRGVMGISCKTRLTEQRTYELWENFLTYMDSTPPVLPEPSVRGSAE